MRADRTSQTLVLLAGISFGIVGILVHGVLSVRLGIGYAIPTTIVAAIAGAVALRGPLGQALARMLHGETVELPPDQILGELDDLRTRLGEIEERTDFAERLLARQREEAEGK